MGNWNSSSIAHNEDASAPQVPFGSFMTTKSSTMTLKHKNTTKNYSSQRLRAVPSPVGRIVEEERPQPKHMLWGCSTTEEHYDAVEEACNDSSNQHGSAGLKRLGFEFRQIHSHPCTCCGQRQSDESKHMMNDVESRSDDEPSEAEVEGDNDNHNRFDNSGSVSSLEEEEEEDDDEEDEVERMRSIFNMRNMSNSNRFSEGSAATMFSLATHHSIESIEYYDESSPRSVISPINHRTNKNTRGGEEEIHGQEYQDSYCAHKLFHIPSNTLVTEKNHQTFIAHGRMYNETSRLCMEYAQDLMIVEGNLEWVPVCYQRNIRALVSTSIRSNSDGGQIRRRKMKPTLVIITGKGKVGAGIFSRRLSMTQGVEPATALSFVQEAVQRDMDIIVLDPNIDNNQDKINAMEVVATSLEQLCFQNTESDDSVDNNDAGIYVLAHSMAGSQLVRFLLNKANDKEEGGTIKSSLSATDLLERYLDKIKAVVFTDSNHNINWITKYPCLVHYFTGPQTIYFKSHKIHDEPKLLGESHDECQSWKHRFGSITTLWAGTNEHALTNFATRFRIWDHFDSFRVETRDSCHHQKRQGHAIE